jgi:hypothetical protein
MERQVVRTDHVIKTRRKLIVTRRTIKWIYVGISRCHLADPGPLIHLTFAFIINGKSPERDSGVILADNRSDGRAVQPSA